MTLLGGEPLLNERLMDFIKITREVFANIPIYVFTDGLLLYKWGLYEDDRNIWKAIKKYRIMVKVTQYPIEIQLDRTIEQAEKYDVPIFWDTPYEENVAGLWILVEEGDRNYRGEKKSTKHPFDLSGNVEKYKWVSCYHFNYCTVLRSGKIYPCPLIPYSVYYNKAFNQNLEIKDDCYIDIYKAKSYKEIAEFLTHRVSFCDYCAVDKRCQRSWKQSEHSMEEWTL
jgi:MoaA/NifB/PqqE/SkfB family radical SAM enzyme